MPSARTVRERKFKRAILKAISKSKSTTRALSSLLSYDVPNGPEKPRSLSIWSSTANELSFILGRVIEGEPIPDYTKQKAARIKALLNKKMGW